MIKKTIPLRILLLPVALFVLGCFVAFSATSHTRPLNHFKHLNIAQRDTSGNVIQVIHADITTSDERDNKNLLILEGNVVLKQGRTTFKSNKAIKDNILNTFEAWGKVHIIDADTTNIHADHLKYIGSTQVANLDGNVKLTDGQVTLTTPSLQYDMITNIGIYDKGGKVVNKKTVITSKEGEYYRDIQDVFFKKDVVVNDPAYNIVSDSLQYNTGTQITTFITMTHIKDSARRTIDTKEGYYNLKTGQAEFGQRPFINDDNKSTLRADKVYLDDNIAKAEGNAIAVDSVRGTIIIANLIFQNRTNEAILATQKPVMIIKQDNDSIFVAADTLFSAKLSELYIVQPAPIDSSQIMNNNPEDSISAVDSLDTTGLVSLLNHKDSLETPVPNNDSLAIKPEIKDSTLRAVSADSTQVPQNLKDSLQVQEQPKVNLLENKAAKDSASGIIPKKDSVVTADKPQIISPTEASPKDSSAEISVATDIPAVDAGKKDSAVITTKRDVKAIASTFDTTKSKAASDSTDRYFEAFHNVRIYSDSMQAISDSMFYSFKDSTFRLYKRPVVWGKESQITGDTILLHTKNNKPQWMEAFRNGFMVNYIGIEAYNQIKATRIDAYFLDGGLDSVRAKGSAECIYYLQDDDSAFTGVNKSTCDIIDSYFENKQLHKVAFRSNVQGTIFPIRQKKPSEMKLEGFIWREAERPKSKYELFE